jgi:hypothetical protein
MEGRLREILTSELYGSEWSTSLPGRIPVYPLGGLRDGLDTMEEREVNTFLKILGPH